jgi:DNA mismatch repair ATPase MutS
MNWDEAQARTTVLRLHMLCSTISPVTSAVLDSLQHTTEILERNLSFILVWSLYVNLTVEIGMKTMSVLVDEENREVTFLYKLIDGISEKSYGMNVAAMAGVPHDVVAKAEEAAREFELGSRLAKSLERSGRGAEVSLALQSDFAWLGRLANGVTEEEDDLLDVTRRLSTLMRVVGALDQ